MKKLILPILLLIMLSTTVFSAIIHGTIYDMNLNKRSNVIVEVNSSPNQRMASIDGTYSFNLQKGDYIITAIYNSRDNLQSTEEKVTISGEGDYVLDLFLFPDISSEEGLFNESDITISVPYRKDYTPYYLTGILLLLIIGLAALSYKLFIKKKGEKKEPKVNESKEKEHAIEKREDADLNRIITILKKQDGRATQKDIRKEIPLSEAKISLMIAELEAEGRIKKIKKGRGNIIVLK